MEKFNLRRRHELVRGNYKHFPDGIRGDREREMLFDRGVRDLITTLDAARGVVQPGVRPEIRSAFADHIATELAGTVPIPDVPDNSGGPKAVWTRLMYQEIERRRAQEAEQRARRPKIFRIPWGSNRII